jgi:hypothetical protein
MDAVGAALEPADDDGPVSQVDVIPTQIASLGEAQADDRAGYAWQLSNYLW